jgi:two-component system phosphate regulon sensor histidine kinase PhoR
MRPGLSPNLLALLATLTTLAISVPLVLWLVPGPYPWLETAIFTAFDFLVIRLLLEWAVFAKLRRLQKRLHQALPSNRPLSERPEKDPIYDIYIELEELIRRNQAELGKLKELESFRREFVGDVSHELKTPLFTIQGFLETLIDGALEDKNVNLKFLKQALRNVMRLNGIVQDLLVLSQLEAGELAMKPEEFKVHEVVLDVIDLLEYKQTDKGRNVQIVLDDQGHEAIKAMADPERIRQVLYNLVDNAIIYGKPDGRVRIEVQPLNGPGAPAKVRIAVHDDGPGIDADHLPHLFNRFYRVDKSRSREKGGTGLGLAIVKNILEAHGERIRVHSTPGTGSTFEFSLPRA